LVAALKYGALGIGLAVLFYTATLLRQELVRKGDPRPEARKLIWTYMAFSLALFGVAVFLEIKSLAADVAGIARGMDDRLDAKFKMAIKHVADPGLKDTLEDNTTQLCDYLIELRTRVGIKEAPKCAALRSHPGLPSPSPH
jgi:hypothetical protein